MTIDWAHFTPLWSTLGGLLVGLAASIFILFHGRIMGVSGILAGLIRPLKGDVAWRLSFFLGLISAPIGAKILGILPAIDIEGSPILLIIAGLLVGFGTNFGSGCTSGHGVCGIARLSPRSITATLTFMTTGVLAVWIMHHSGIGG
jgi:uncharacterized membrane protein YedE/YeeE